ncbi:MAG: Rieske (2Fe-2S) protein [Nitrospirota bacterium]
MDPNRRTFITKSLYGALTILGLGFFIPAARILVPSAGPEKATVFYPLISEDEVPRAGVKRAELSYTVSGKERKARVFLVSSPEGLTALSATCSHLGCLVNYRKDRREFLCPCHGGRYELSGKHIAGPPPAPLTRFPVKVEKGVVLVGIKV